MSLPFTDMPQAAGSSSTDVSQVTGAPLLHLLHLVSPALPVGAYAYSQGLEWAVEADWLRDPDDPKSLQPLRRWLTGLLEHGLGHLDLPVLARCIEAWQAGRFDEVDRWNDFIRAARETHELLLEDEQMGQALARLLNDLGVSHTGATVLGHPPSFVSQFALATWQWRIPLPQALTGFAWSWLENQVAAATKLVPLGQTQAQVLLLQLMPLIEPVCERAFQLPDDGIGISLPGLALASAQHERQYSRLFRS